MPPEVVPASKQRPLTPRRVRNYCGEPLPEGLAKNARLERNLLTPTTKADDHDEPVTPAQIVERGLMTQTEWDEVARMAQALFARGQEMAARNGLLLVDTKYEFGRDTTDGSVRLIDEVHTPDSSRYWVASTYAQRHAEGAHSQRSTRAPLRPVRSTPHHATALPTALRSLHGSAWLCAALRRGAEAQRRRGAAEYPRGGGVPPAEAPSRPTPAVLRQGAREHRQGVFAPVVQGPLRPLQGRDPSRRAHGTEYSSECPTEYHTGLEG